MTIDTSKEAVDRLALLHEGISFAEATGLRQCLVDVDDARFMHTLAAERDAQTARADAAEAKVARLTAALAASRAAPDCHQPDLVTADKVRVKPLVWFEGEEPGEWKSGEYDIWCEFGKYQLYYWSIVHGNPHPTAEAAKSAAQADYEARILAALDLTPAPAVQPVALTAQDAARDVELLLSAYKGLLVLHRIMAKSGLHAGEKTTSELADRIVAAHPEFPARAALRAIGGDA